MQIPMPGARVDSRQNTNNHVWVKERKIEDRVDLRRVVINITGPRADANSRRRTDYRRIYGVQEFSRTSLNHSSSSIVAEMLSDFFFCTR